MGIIPPNFRELLATCSGDARLSAQVSRALQRRQEPNREPVVDRAVPTFLLTDDERALLSDRQLPDTLW